jgi:hypothetical protein
MYSEILERARHFIELSRPDASPQRHAAFANAVAYLVTGEAGGYGGPSVREHAASALYRAERWKFEQAVAELLDPGGPIFGPLTELHHDLWLEFDCRDDDPDDLEQLRSWS